MKNSGRYKIAVIILSTIGLLSAGYALRVQHAEKIRQRNLSNETELSQYPECDDIAADSQLVSAKLKYNGSETSLRFPFSYLVPLGFKDGGTRGAIIFEVRADNFQPYYQITGSARKPEKSDKGPNPDDVTILINMINSDFLGTYLNNLVDLRTGKSDSLASATQMKQTNGLLKLQTQSWQREDLFVAQSNALVTDLVECSILGTVLYPNCQHMFIFENMNVKMTYFRDYLDRWLMLKAKALKTMQCFRSLSK